MPGQLREIGALQHLANTLRNAPDEMIEQKLMEQYRRMKQDTLRQRQEGTATDAYEIVIAGIVIGALPGTLAHYQIRGDLVVEELIAPDHMRKIDEIAQRLGRDRRNNASDSSAHAGYVETLITQEAEDYFDVREKNGDPKAAAGKLLAYAMGYSEGSLNPSFREHSTLADEINSFGKL